MRRPRWSRAAALGLGLLLSAFEFQEGLHSAHHLSSDGEPAGSCPVALTAAQISGTVVEAVTVEPPPPCVFATLVERAPASPSLDQADLDRGRSPPETIG